MAGYHKRDIPKGAFGTPQKIREELLEFEDALEQGNRLMALLELSDLIGAIKGYLEKEYGDKIILVDLVAMAEATKRAFLAGERK